MRKLLALLLAMVMTLGLATVGTNAAVKSTKDFKDYEDINYDEAITVLTNLGILDGMDEGKFNPQGTLTREQGAKIIAYLILGTNAASTLQTAEEDDSASKTAGDIYTDVANDRWSARYIEYLTHAGIVGGKGKADDGKDIFDPTGTLTTQEFAKMLLTALGYDAKIESLIGADWAVNTLKLAAQTGLFNGNNDVLGSSECLREEAALYAFNALQIPMVQYTNGARYYMTSAARDTQTISYAQINEGSARGTYMVEFAEQHFPQLKRDSLTTDDWGRPETTWTLNREVIAKYADSTKFVKSWINTVAKGSEIYDEVGGSTLLNTFANNQNPQNNNLRLFIDGVNYTEGTDAQKAIAQTVFNTIKDKSTSSDALENISGRGRVLELYIDEDVYENFTAERTQRYPQITLVVINTWLAQAVNAPASGKVDLDVYTDAFHYGQRVTADDTKLTSTDSDAKKAEDFAKGEYLLVSLLKKANGTDIKEVRELKKAETQTTAVNAYTVNKTNTKLSTVKVGDTTHNVALTAVYDESLLNTNRMETLAGFTYNLYLNTNGDLMGITKAATSDNLVFVSGISRTTALAGAGNYTANLIYTNGNQENNVNVATAVNGSARTWLNTLMTAGQNKYDLNTWFTYNKAANGAVTLVNVIPAAGAANAATGVEANGYRQSAYQEPAANIANYNDWFEIWNVNGAYTGRAVAGDDTAIVTVSQVNTTINGQIVPQIDRVRNVAKGIKNIFISVADTLFTQHPLTRQANANVFFVYNPNGFVVAAVAVTDRTVARNVVYNTNKAMTSRTAVANATQYLDAYKMIVSGQNAVVDKNVLSGSTNTDMLKLTKDALFDVDYDADGNIVYAVPAYVGLPNNVAVNGSAADTYGVLKLDNERVTSIEVDGSNVISGMLGTRQVGYIRTSANGNYFVQENESDTYTRYNTAYEAFKAATHWNDTVNHTNGVYEVVEALAICDGTGWANTVVFRAMANNTTRYARNVALNNLYYTITEYEEMGRAAKWSDADTNTAYGIYNTAVNAISNITTESAANTALINTTLANALYNLKTIDGRYEATNMGLAIDQDSIVFNAANNVYGTQLAGWSYEISYRPQGSTTFVAFTSGTEIPTTATVRVIMRNAAGLAADYNAVIDPATLAAPYFQVRIGGAVVVPNGTAATLVTPATATTPAVWAYDIAPTNQGALELYFTAVDEKTVTDNFWNDVVINEKNQVTTDEGVVRGDLWATTIGDLTVKTGADYTIDDQHVQTIMGNLTVEPGATLTITNGKVIRVLGVINLMDRSPLIATAKGQLIVTGGSNLNVTNALASAAEVNVLDGDLYVRGGSNVTIGTVGVAGPATVIGPCLIIESGTATLNCDVAVEDGGELIVGDEFNTTVPSRLIINGDLILEPGAWYEVFSDATAEVNGDLVKSDLAYVDIDNTKVYQVEYYLDEVAEENLLEDVGLLGMITTDGTDAATYIAAQADAKAKELKLDLADITAADVTIEGQTAKVVLKAGSSETPAADKEYTVTLAYGTDNAEGATATLSAEKAKKDTEITVTAAEGFELVTVTAVYGDEAAEVTVTDGKFTMPEGDVTVTATLKAKETEPELEEDANPVLDDGKEYSSLKDALEAHGYAVIDAYDSVTISNGTKVTLGADDTLNADKVTVTGAGSELNLDAGKGAIAELHVADNGKVVWTEASAVTITKVYVPGDPDKFDFENGTREVPAEVE